MFVTGNRYSFEELKKPQKNPNQRSEQALVPMLWIVPELKETWGSGIFQWEALRSEFLGKLSQQGHAGLDAAVMLSSLQAARVFIWFVGWIWKGFVGIFWGFCLGFFSFSCSVNPDSTGKRSEQLSAEDLEEIWCCVRLSVWHGATTLSDEIMLLPTFFTK